MVFDQHDNNSNSSEIEMIEEITAVSVTSSSEPLSSKNKDYDSSGRSKILETKEAWAGIMSKMRVQRTEKKKKESADAWIGLMKTMQKNQEKPIKNNGNSKKGKNSSSKRQNTSKKQAVNPAKGLKRLKSAQDNNNSNSNSLSIQNAIITIEDEQEEENEEEEIKDNVSQPVQLPPPPPAPLKNIHPMFLPKAAKSSTTDTNNTKDDNGSDSQMIKNKIMQMQSSGHPWKTDSHLLNSTPEVIEINENGNGLGLDNGNDKKTTKNCPFYKKLPGTKFSVDAFNYGIIDGIDVYFLSHFHYDHYQGLTRKFSKTIICSSPTGNLVEMKIGVASQCIRKLELNKKYLIQGSEIVLIDANHCPGSVMFTVKMPNGTTYLHTGDFRYTTEMLENHFLNLLRLDCLYLDTTYCDPRYDFPTQTASISQAITTLKKHLAYRPKTLIICGAYVIGKERVFFTIAEAIGTKVYCESDKRKIINALENSYFKNLLDTNEAKCQVHVVSMNKLNPQTLSQYLAQRSKTYSNIFAIKPTGWEFSKGPGKSVVGSNVKSHLNDTVTIMGIPYSEHSSFSELKNFVVNVKPKRVQPTVNVGNTSKRTSMMDYIDTWLASA